MPGGANIGLIGVTARYALDHGFDVIVEGIMSAQRYRDMLAELARGHRGTSTFFYFDVSFDETVQRHATRPQSADFTSEEMRGWYRPDDRLGILGEHVLPQHLSLQAAVDEVHNLGFCSNA